MRACLIVCGFQGEKRKWQWYKVMENVLFVKKFCGFPRSCVSRFKLIVKFCAKTYFQLMKFWRHLACRADSPQLSVSFNDQGGRKTFMVSSFSLQNTPTLQARNHPTFHSVISSGCHPKNGELNKKKRKKKSWNGLPNPFTWRLLVNFSGLHRQHRSVCCCYYLNEKGR